MKLKHMRSPTLSGPHPFPETYTLKAVCCSRLTNNVSQQLGRTIYNGNGNIQTTRLLVPYCCQIRLLFRYGHFWLLRRRAASSII